MKNKVKTRVLIDCFQTLNVTMSNVKNCIISDQMKIVIKINMSIFLIKKFVVDFLSRLTILKIKTTVTKI